MKRNLQPVYVNPEPEPADRYGEPEMLKRKVPIFEYRPVTIWNRWIKFMNIEKVR